MNILDPNKWDFVGVGGLNSNPICNLNDRNDLCIQMIQNVPENEYKQILGNSDIGLSLTFTPNPSFSTFDFAAAGMIVVTNSFETRTQETFNQISRNFIVVKPSLNEIVNGISKALLKIDNVKERLRDSKLNLPSSWSDEKCYGMLLFDKMRVWFKNFT